MFCCHGLQVQVHVINPLALSNNELYGSFDEGTHEWQDGVLARIMRTVCKDESLDQKWILFDGPVDTLWIESMNTLLDDNKLLTLLSGERISMSPQARSHVSRSDHLCPGYACCMLPSIILVHITKAVTCSCMYCETYDAQLPAALQIHVNS